MLVGLFFLIQIRFVVDNKERNNNAVKGVKTVANWCTSNADLLK